MKSVVCKELDISISFEPVQPHCRRGWGWGATHKQKTTKSESGIVEEVDPRLQGWLLFEPKLKPGPGAFSLSPSHPTHKNSIKCSGCATGGTGRDGEWHLSGNCNPEDCILCLTFCHVISDTHVLICPGFAIKQNIEFSTILYLAVMQS